MNYKIYYPANSEFPFRLLVSHLRHKNTILLALGRGEPLEKYLSVLPYFEAVNINYILLEWTGQGGTVGYFNQNFHLNPFDIYQVNLKQTLVHLHELGCHLQIVLGHSMSGLVFNRHRKQNHSICNRYFYLSPWLRFSNPFIRWIISKTSQNMPIKISSVVWDPLKLNEYFLFNVSVQRTSSSFPM